MAAKLIPVSQAQKDYTAHVLFALSDFGAGTGDWNDMVDHAVRSMKRGLTVHACVFAWLHAHPVELQRVYTETQHEGGAR
jgi:uncharacterized protein YfaS (alpha-2-macroglobulin family)